MDLNEYEIKVLEMLNGDRPGEWGAWVSVCLEHLEGLRLCTRGPHYEITDLGRTILGEHHKQQGSSNGR